MSSVPFFFFNDTATTEIYTLSLHDALPISFRAATGPWEKQLAAAESGGPPLTYQGLVDSYLTETHRDHPGNGCPISALAGDIARGGKQIRPDPTQQINNDLELLTNFLPPPTSTPPS